MRFLNPRNRAPGRDTGERNDLPRVPTWILLAAALAFVTLAGVYAFSITFGRFSYYDDEGFMMISIRGFLDGHPLYDSVYTIIGPFYYFYRWAIHVLASLPLTHDVTRSLCVLHWLMASAILAVAGGRLTKSTWVAFFIFMQATLHLSGLAYEPGHPQELVVLLLALAALSVASNLKCSSKMVLLGAICAALASTKINVGAFFGFALFLGFACHTPFFQERRRWFAPLLVVSGLLPFLLMRAHLDQEWARQVGWLASVSILATGAMTYCSVGHSRIGLSQWVQSSLGFFGLLAFLLCFVFLSGTSPSQLIDCLLISPSKVPNLFSIPLDDLPNSYWAATASLVLVVLWMAMHRRLNDFWLPVALAKLTYGVLGALVLLGDRKEQFGYLLPWLWLVLVRTNQDNGSKVHDTLPRAILCLVAAFEGLQVYPVAATQVVVATFLPILVYSLCLHDAVSAFRAQHWVSSLQGKCAPRTAILLQVLLIAGLLNLFAVKWCKPVQHWRRYVSLRSLELPGSRHIRLSPPVAECYRSLTEYLETECDTFLTCPGLNSLHFWTRKPPLTYFNVHEVVLLSIKQQSEVIAALQRTERALVVVSKRVPASTLGPDATSGPLERFIREDCIEVKRVGYFRILSPKKGGSSIIGFTSENNRSGRSWSPNGVLDGGLDKGSQNRRHSSSPPNTSNTPASWISAGQPLECARPQRRLPSTAPRSTGLVLNTSSGTK